MFEFMRNQINAKRCRSAWDKGVRLYALELIDSIEEAAECEGEQPANERELKCLALNGAADWQQYSEGGCSLIYNKQIAERLCTASELKKTDNGRKDPNARESWIDCQARALFQAWIKVCTAYQAAKQLMGEPDGLADPEEIPLF